MHNVSCYNCHGQTHTPYAVENGYRLVKCSCGLLYVNPQPDEDEIQEAHKYGEHRGEQTLQTTGWFHPERIPEYRQVLRDLFPQGFTDRVSWLDIGCGHGEFLLALKEPCIDALGVEPNEAKQKAARNRGLNVSFFDLDSHDKTYDVVSLLNVYSHLPDPPATLAGWKRLLNPGGVLLLQTGDTADLDASVHYRPFYLPDHLSFASEKIVCALLKRTGFEVEEIRKYPFVRPSLVSFAREGAKLFWPGKTSKMRYLVQHRKYVTDMYVLARLRG